MIRRVPKFLDADAQGKKTGYGTKLANELAREFSAELRRMGVKDALPDPETGRGGERRFAGGIGAKKVDVSFATEELGLVLAISLKGIYAADKTALDQGRGARFGKNRANRLGELVAESMTLHKRFPYAVVGGVFLLDRGSMSDSRKALGSTFHRVHRATKQFAGRSSYADAEERFEALSIGVFDSQPSLELFWAGDWLKQISVKDILSRLLHMVAERNSEYFDFDGKSFVYL